MPRSTSFVLDDDHSTPATVADAPSRGGFEWGLASTLIGATFLVMGPVAMLFCLVLWNGGSEQHGLRMADLQLAQIAALVCAVGAEVVCLLGLSFGMRGLGVCRRDVQPAALPWAGILLCAAAMVLWLIVGIDLIAILSAFTRWKGAAAFP